MSTMEEGNVTTNPITPVVAGRSPILASTPALDRPPGVEDEKKRQGFVTIISPLKAGRLWSRPGRVR